MPRIRLASSLFLLLLLCATPPSRADAPDDLAHGRLEFQAAYALANDPRPTPDTGGDAEVLRNYPLYPYLVAARLQRRIDDPAAAPAIGQFLEEQGNAPAARSLRRSWLMSLAGRKAWEPYLSAYREDVDDTTAARCAYLTARVATGRTQGLAEAVTATWLSPRSVPEACDPAFDWLRQQGLVTPELIERRARLALDAGEAGLARYLARSLSETRAAPILQWANLVERPRAAIEALIADPSTPVEPQALLDGWSRFARGDPEGAADLYPALVRARGLDARSASPHALAVALPLSWSRLPRSLEFFALGRPEDFDERTHEWQVRAALWSGDWARAGRAIESMPEALRSQNRWRYWAARSAEQRGDREAARAGYAAVLPTDNWYAALSAARTGQHFAPTLEPLPRDPAMLDAVASEPRLVRTRELLLCDMKDEANREWRVALEVLSPAQQVQAVRLASNWGWHLQAIAAAARLGLFNDYELLYPRPYDAEVRRGTELTGLPPSLIYAIIRQESLYQPDAASSANALGLMQLLPSTAQATARRAGLPKPTRTGLLQPEVNVPLGSTFLRQLVDRAGGQWPLAIAGYNAGPVAAARWLAPTPVETDVWVENIPYNETRAYVQRVHWHSLVFRWLAERKPQEVAWLGTVRAPATETVAADEG